MRGSWNVFLRPAARQGAGKVVFASSDKAYGTAPELPYREDFPLRADHPYDSSKAAADVMARGLAREWGLPIAVSRFANVYGGGDLNFTRLVPETAIAVADGGRRGSAPTGPHGATSSTSTMRSRRTWRSPAALERGRGGRRGVQRRAATRPHSVREVVDLVAEVGGGEVEPEYGPGLPRGEILDQYLDSTKLRELTGWAPAVDLRTGPGAYG